MLKATSIIALAAFFATTPVMAQTTTTQQAAQPSAETQGAPAVSANQPAPEAKQAIEENQATGDIQSGETRKSPETALQTTTNEEKTSQPVMGQIVLQSESTILSNDLVGSSVYAPNDEVVGDINDMIIDLGGTVEGVVIGVGGFLGIGEKDVAVKMSAISVTPMEDGNVRLVLNSTKQDLETAPAFKSVAEQKVDEEVEQARKTQQEGIIRNNVPSTEPAKPESSTQ